MICTAEQALKEAARWVGYVEKKSSKHLDSKTANAGDKNYTIFGKVMHDIYPKTMDYPAPWCDAFVDYCVYKACGGVLQDASYVLCGRPDDYTVNSAQMYKSAKCWSSKAKVGAQVFFKNSSGICHTGLVEKVDKRYVYTIEGNTSTSAGVVANGGGVCRKKYELKNSRIAGYGYPRYTVAGKEPSVLYGVDVSSNQPKNILQKVEFDFAFVKMGGNPHGYAWDYVNPYAKAQVKDALKKTDCVGLYWFCYGKTAKLEADYFVKKVDELGMLGKAVLVADYEADALKKGRGWLKRFCKRVEKQAGCKPVIYASGSVITDQRLDALGYELWCANYSKGSRRIDGYDTSGCTKYVKGAKLWQFTEHGYLMGYNAKLDLNRFDGSKAEFKKLNAKFQAKYIKYRVVPKNGVNARKAPSISADKTRVLRNGRIVYVSVIKDGWAKTKRGDWCIAKYLKKL